MKKIGRYEIVEELGRGAMGVVYKASDPTIGRMVAIKLLLLARPSQSGLPGVKDIFLREARAAGRLSHPGIVTVHDALEDPESESCYIVMEFVPGRTLEKALLSGSPFSIEKSLDFACQIAEALDYAHGQRIIHRDLKPANILLTEDGRSKITDFGIAKVVASEDAQRTLAIMGTPAYMSPEQVTGGQIDAASDVFSLGILLYLMLTGEKPFSGDTAAVMFKIAYQDPAPPSQVRTELGKGHDFLLLRALAKDKKKRYANAREFLNDLDDVQHCRPPRSEAQVPMSELHAGDLTVRASRPLVPALKSTSAATPNKQGAIWTGGIAALAVLLAAGSWLVRHRNAPAPAAVVQPQPSPAPPPQTVLSGHQPAAESSVAPAEAEKTNVPAASKTPKELPKPENKRTGPATPKTAAAARPSPVPLPLTPTELPHPEEGKPSPLAPAPAAAAQTSIQFYCRYELKEAKLTLLADTQNVLSVDLQGRKTGKLLGLRHGYAGAFARPLKIPSGARNLTVHIQTDDKSINLARSIAVAAANGKPLTLHVIVSEDELQLSW